MCEPATRQNGDAQSNGHVRANGHARINGQARKTTVTAHK
jgi:hypothetical protein